MSATFFKKPPLFSWILFVSIVIFAFTRCGHFTYNDEYELAKEVYRLVNLHRVSNGLNGLVWNWVVSEQCQIHSENMASGEVGIGHAGLDQRASIISEEIPYSKLYENVGYLMDLMGISSPASSMVEAWLDSQEHRIAIEGQYNITGVGVAVNGTEYYFTQIFLKSN